SLRAHYARRHLVSQRSAQRPQRRPDVGLVHRSVCRGLRAVCGYGALPAQDAFEPAAGHVALRCARCRDSSRRHHPVRSLKGSYFMLSARSACLAALALGFGAVAGVASAAEMNVAVELPKLEVAEYHRPYVAMWIEREDQSFVANFSVWYQERK